MATFDLQVFALRLREALDGRTHRELCEHLGVSQRSLLGWLAGSHQPRAGVVAELAHLLEVRADWLLGLDNRRTRR